MGFFDSIARKALNKAVGNVVDQAIDSVFGNNENQPQQTPQPTTSRIIRPDLNGTAVQDTLLSRWEGEEYGFKYEKSDKMYISSSGALEVPIYYIVADSEEEAYEDDLCTNLPEIYIGDDEIADTNSRMLKDAQNIVVTDVVEHGIIKKKYEFDRKSDIEGQCHYIAYKFFVDKNDEAKGAYTVITLRLPSVCSQEKKIYAVQSLNLLACTMVIE